MESINLQLTKNIQLEPTDVETYASWRKAIGHNVVYNEGIYWEEVFKGFYQPVHMAQKLNIEQVKSPRFVHWGVRSALVDEDSKLANGVLRFYTFENIKSFDITCFPHQRRSNIRKCFRNVEIKEIKDEKIMQDQGYQVLYSSLHRTNHLNIPSKNEYCSKCGAYINNGNNGHIILGAFLHNRLLAFLELCAVRETAYLVNMMIATEALHFCVSPGLFYTAFLLCRESNNIKQVFAGGPTPDDPGLEIFKKRMGFTVVEVPTFCKIPKVFAFIMKLKCAETYHQLLSTYH